jgi:TolB protein
MFSVPRTAASAAIAVASAAGVGTAMLMPGRSEATPPGTNGAVAFQRFAGPREDARTAQIFTRSPSGEVKKLTRFNGGAFDPAWSPDGSRIAFERWFARAKKPDQLFTMAADGSDVRKLTSGCGPPRCLWDDWASYAPDGGRIAFVRAYGPLRHKRFNEHDELDYPSAADIMVVDAAGGAPTLVRHFTADPQPEPGGVAWSPDGTRFVVALSTLKQPTKHTNVSSALFVMNSDGSAERRITPWALGAGNPDWSPDGSTIVFNSQGGHSHNIHVVQPGGSGLKQLLKGNSADVGLGPVENPSWSPDGKEIILTAPKKRGNYVQADIYTLATDGSNVKPLVVSAKMEHAVAWQPLR